MNPGDIILLNGLRDIAQEGLWMTAGVMPPSNFDLKSPSLGIIIEPLRKQCEPTKYPNVVTFSMLTMNKGDITWTLTNQELATISNWLELDV